MEASNSASASLGKFPDTELELEMQSSLDVTYLALYGFTFTDTYRHVLRFYKGKNVNRLCVDLHFIP